jgi:hypothetical protein
VKPLASLLRGLADRLDPTPAPSMLPVSPDAQGVSDDRFIDNLILRDALDRALNRYQPFRPPAQA